MKRLPKGQKAQVMGTRMFQTMYTADQMREFAKRLVAEPHKWVEPREWRGLTDEEAVEVMRQVPHLTIGGLLAVEAKLKEKNT